MITGNTAKRLNLSPLLQTTKKILEWDSGKKTINRSNDHWQMVEQTVNKHADHETPGLPPAGRRRSTDHTSKLDSIGTPLDISRPIAEGEMKSSRHLY